MSHNERDRPIPVPTNPAPSVPRGSASLSERSSRPTQPDYAAAPVLPHTNHCGSPYRPVRRSLACSVSDGRPARHTGSRTSISAAPRRTARRPALLCCAGRRWRSRAPALLALRWRARARGPSESMRLTTSRSTHAACRRPTHSLASSDEPAADSGHRWGCAPGRMSVEPRRLDSLRACVRLRRRREGRPKGGGDGPDVLPGLPCH